MLITFKRVLKFGWQSFYRNKALTAQVVFILFVAVFVISFLFLFREMSDFLISEAENKVDISVYFKQNTQEPSILGAKERLENLENVVKRVEYVSQDEAKLVFMEKHRDDPLYLESLNEVEGNPFFASLNISAINPDQYEYIAGFFAEQPLADIVERISYNRNKAVIDRLFKVISNVEITIIAMSVFFALLAALITFNTIKLSILSIRREIATRRLVGADNWFIRGPFLAQAGLYALTALVVFDALFVLVVVFLNAQLKPLLLDFDLLKTVVIRKGIWLLLIQLGFVLFISLVSSWLAVRKYLKV